MISLYKRDFTAKTPSVSSVALSAFIKSCTEFVWSCHCGSTHAASPHSSERERQQMSKERQTHGEHMKVWKPRRDCYRIHARFFFFCVLLILGITAEAVKAAGCTSGPRPRLAGRPDRVAVQQVSAPILLPPSAWRHTSENDNFAETFLRRRRSATRSARGCCCCLLPPPRPQKVQSWSQTTATTAGCCQGTGKHIKAGRRNFPLAQEIGTSCAATQSNHRLLILPTAQTCHMVSISLFFCSHCCISGTGFSQFVHFLNRFD